MEEGAQSAGVLDVAVGVADVDVVAAGIGLEVGFNMNFDSFCQLAMISKKGPSEEVMTG